MTLYIIGIGLCDEKDISIRGLEAVRKCSRVYLESYTSLLQVSVRKLEKAYGTKVLAAERKDIEDMSGKLIRDAKAENIALLVIGDVFSATTHSGLIMEAKKQGVKVRAIFNASIMTAVGITGLQLYNFGKTASIPYPEKGYSPLSYYNVYLQNRRSGLHTLFLLDIKAEDGRFMSINEAVELLLSAAKKHRDKGKGFSLKTLCVGCARLGSSRYKIRCRTAGKLLKEGFGRPPHCLIVPGKMHFAEEELIRSYS